MTLDRPDPERWLPVPGYHGHYEVFDMGRVRSVAKTTNGGHLIVAGKKIQAPRHRPSQLLKVSYGGRNNRYLRVMLRAGGNKKRHAFIHHLVLEAFVGPRPTGLVAAHEDDDQANNTLENLSWKTEEGNLQDRLERERHDEDEGRSEPGPDPIGQPSRENEPDEDEPGIDPNTYADQPAAPF